MEFLQLEPDPHAPYFKMYTALFMAVTAALYMMDGGEFMKARAVLVRAQQETEELYISADD